MKRALAWLAGLAGIAAAYDRANQPARARELYEEALTHLEIKDTPRVATDVWVSYADLLDRQGDTTAALAAYRQATGARTGIRQH